MNENSQTEKIYKQKCNDDLHKSIDLLMINAIKIRYDSNCGMK